MGAAGTDTALETANIALMGGDVTKIPYLYGLSRKVTSALVNRHSAIDLVTFDHARRLCACANMVPRIW